MPEDDNRSADTLEEIRDLLIELRDLEKSNADETRQQLEKSQRLQVESVRRQKLATRLGSLLFLIGIAVLFWVLWPGLYPPEAP